MKINTCRDFSKIPNARLKLDQKSGCLYWDGKNGKVYVGHKDMHTNMIDESLVELLENGDVSPREMEAAQDINSLWGDRLNSAARSMLGDLKYPICKIPVKKSCEFCNGFGVWQDDSVPLLEHEVTWGLSDLCPKCGSHNHLEYMDDYSSTPWKEYKNIGFHAALENFNRSIKCVEL